MILRAKESNPEAKPRLITDNGPQFIARDFKEFARHVGITHVRIRPYYSQSNGKIERWHQSLKKECIRPKTPISYDDAKRVVADYVVIYNTQRLHSGIGYITPFDKLAGKAEVIHAKRERRLDQARWNRSRRRKGQPAVAA